MYIQIISKMIAKDNLNIENLMQTLENLPSKLLYKILRYCTQIDLGYVQLNFVQMVAPPTLFAK